MKKVLVQSKETIYYQTEIEMPDDFDGDDLNCEIQSLLENDDFDFSHGETENFITVDDWEIIG